MEVLPKSRLLRFVEQAMHLARRAVARYSSKFSKRRYTLHQHIVLLCLKVRKNTTYRTLLDELIEMPRIRSALILRRSRLFRRCIRHSTALAWQFGGFFSISQSRFSRPTVSSESTPRASTAVTPQNTTRSEQR
ncbi:transposase IS4 family protein [Natrinema limicola JCM 13563]|uniref:Transposase IS4 family protein n=1 Tax=Natrinema limicola JCM 13563 TaxID=1230457 RepID=M0BY63_9EURY|nr:transposase IS4 family protein [Natrinema limicola JCM 13563]